MCYLSSFLFPFVTNVTQNKIKSNKIKTNFIYLYYKKGQIVLIDKKINDLQNLIKRKISYDEVAPILGLKSGTALRNWVYRKKPLKEFEIEKIDEAFGIKDFKKQQNTSTEETVAVDYYPEVFGSCGDGKFIVSE